MEHFDLLARDLTLPNLIGVAVIFAVGLGHSAVRWRARRYGVPRGTPSSAG